MTKQIIHSIKTNILTIKNHNMSIFVSGYVLPSTKSKEFSEEITRFFFDFNKCGNTPLV